MNKQKILDAVKLIKGAFTTQKFKDEKLTDGSTISYESDVLEVGVPVFSVTEQGKLPLPDGDYTIEGGTVFSVAGGVVSAVTIAEEVPEEEVPAAEAPATELSDKAVTPTQAKAIVESIIKETRFAEIAKELESEIAAFKSAKESFSSQEEASKSEIENLKTNYENLKEAFGRAVELIETIADEPTDSPAEGKPSKAVFKNQKEIKEYIHSQLKVTKK